MTAPVSLVDLLQTSVARFPERTAIVLRDRRVSYAEFWNDVQALARSLRAGGLQSGDRVALLLENSPEYATAYYATLAAGGVAVGLSTAARAPELARVVSHCGAAVLIAQREMPVFAELVKTIPNSVRVIETEICHSRESGNPESLKSLDSRFRGNDDTDVPVQVDSSSPAAIIYTSGTTGDPKGVTLTHRNLVANTVSILQYLELTERDSIVNVLPFYYSYGNSVLHTHLAAGGCVVLENSLTYPHLVVQKMADERVTGFSGVPSTFALLLQRVKLGEFKLENLRYFTQAGGAMAPALIERLLAEVPHAKLFVMYGQTEATARLSWLPPERLREKLGSVGIGIPGVTLEVRTEQDKVCAIGEVGEVCARGDNIMRGYWNNPEATARVVRDGWLHTGDLGRKDEDGYLFLVGRASDMIKTGAHRVSPLEIEEAILELHDVAECAAVGVPDPILGEIIKVFVVARQNAALDARAVQAHCRDRLPMHKIPKQIELVAELPRTASGKIKRFMLTGAK